MCRIIAGGMDGRLKRFFVRRFVSQLRQLLYVSSRLLYVRDVDTNCPSRY